MLPNQEKTVNIIGNADGRTQQMGLDSASLPHLMRVLTNLYSDPETAVIREYSTNAYDSHVAAGIPYKPIHVTLPNVFSPQFIVRDFGVGMSETEVFEVFGLYGASTKRESNEYVGQLGLGCKSALTITNQFSLTAIKDGIKCIFSVHLDELGVGRITKLHEEITDSGNGVEVSIPVKETAHFNQKARSFYRFFPVMPNFVGGVAFPDELKPEVIMELDKKMKVVKRVSQDGGNDFIVMGGVAYPYRKSQGFNSGSMSPLGTVVIYADIGDVDFTPSREELHLTPRTKDFIERRSEDFDNAIAKVIQKEIDGAKSLKEHKELLRKFYAELRRLKEKVDTSYEGYPIGLFDLNGVTFTNSQIYTYDINNNRFSEDGEHSNSINDYQLSKSALVVKKESEEVTPSLRSKIRTWTVQENQKGNRIAKVVVINHGDEPHPEYMNQMASAVTTEYIKEEAKATKRAKSKTTPYERVDFSTLPSRYHYGRASKSSYATVSEIPSDRETIFYMEKKDFARIADVNTKLTYAFITKDNEDIKVYLLGKNQVSKFTKTYPKAKHLTELLLSRLDKEISYMEKNVPASLVAEKTPFDSRYGISIPGNHLELSDPELSEVVMFLNQDLRQRNSDGNVAETKNLLAPLRSLVCNDKLTDLSQRFAKIGTKEAERYLHLRKIVSKRYPLMFDQNAKDEALINYANMMYNSVKD